MLLPLLGLVFLIGCKLTITLFTAPDTANTGSVITLTVSCIATEMEDGSSENGVVLQIPTGWTVLRAWLHIGNNQFSLSEDVDVAGLYTAEPGHVIWAGKTVSQTGTDGENVAITIKVLTGDFAGSYGQTRIYDLKAVVGARREGVWITDDPENIFDFSDVTDEKYKKSITVTKIEDNTPPAPIDSTTATCGFFSQNAFVEVQWTGYDEDAQGDVVSYRIYRSDNAFSDISGMEPLGEASIQPSNYQDDSVISGNGYYFAVTAVDELGQENPAVTAIYVYVPIPGSISGTVYQSDGVTPLTGTNTWVQADSGSCGNLEYVNGAMVDPTTGTYSISGLSTGMHYLRAYGNDNYFEEWWASPQSVRDCDSSQTIQVSEGENITGKNFQLDPGATISGTVYQSDGVTPLTGANRVHAYSGSCGNLIWVGSEQADPTTGTYSISGLSPGTYYLRAEPFDTNYLNEWWAFPKSVLDCDSSQTIQVGEEENITGKDFQLDPGGIDISLLGPGWNLISLPVQPSNTAIGNVLSGIAGKYVSVWGFQNGAWQVYDPANPDFSDLSIMEAGWGYWLNMTESATLSVTGSTPSPTMNLITGWNLVGYNSSTAIAIADALSSIAGNVVSVWAFIDDAWLVYDPVNPDFSDLTTMTPGYGYWINANGACTWTTTPVTAKGFRIVSVFDGTNTTSIVDPNGITLRADETGIQGTVTAGQSGAQVTIWAVDGDKWVSTASGTVRLTFYPTNSSQRDSLSGLNYAKSIFSFDVYMAGGIGIFTTTGSSLIEAGKYYIKAESAGVSPVLTSVQWNKEDLLVVNPETDNTKLLLISEKSVISDDGNTNSGTLLKAYMLDSFGNKTKISDTNSTKALKLTDSQSVFYDNTLIFGNTTIDQKYWQAILGDESSKAVKTGNAKIQVGINENGTTVTASDEVDVKVVSKALINSTYLPTEKKKAGSAFDAFNIWVDIDGSGMYSAGDSALSTIFVTTLTVDHYVNGSKIQSGSSNLSKNGTLLKTVWMRASGKNVTDEYFIVGDEDREYGQRKISVPVNLFQQIIPNDPSNAYVVNGNSEKTTVWPLSKNADGLYSGTLNQVRINLNDAYGNSILTENGLPAYSMGSVSISSSKAKEIINSTLIPGGLPDKTATITYPSNFSGTDTPKLTFTCPGVSSVTLNATVPAPGVLTTPEINSVSPDQNFMTSDSIALPCNAIIPATLEEKDSKRRAHNDDKVAITNAGTVVPVITDCKYAPLPFRIGGTVTIDSVIITQATDTGLTFIATKLDGTDYTPVAHDINGVNSSNWYIMDIPLFDAVDQPGGANPGDTAVIHVYLNGNELFVTSPANGHFTVGASGTNLQIKLVAGTPPNLLIAQQPMSGPPGTTFVQWGTGFTPNSTATLHFKKPDGTEYTTQQQPIDAIGHFEINYHAPLDKPPGTYTWWAVDGVKGTSNEVSYEVTPLSSDLTVQTINPQSNTSIYDNFFPSPNPGQLITGGKISTTIAADGESLLLLRIIANTNPGQVTISESDGNIQQNGGLSSLETYQNASPASSIPVQLQPYGSQYIGFAVYRAPIDFAISGYENRLSRPITLDVTYPGGSSSTDLTIRRPPILISHGLWSSGWGNPDIENFRDMLWDSFQDTGGKNITDFLWLNNCFEQNADPVLTGSNKTRAISRSI